MQKEGHCDKRVGIEWIGHIVWKFLANSDLHCNKKIQLLNVNKIFKTCSKFFNVFLKFIAIYFI